MTDLDLKQLIWQELAAIPPGKLTTYGLLAKACGYPTHARYVGRTLKNLPASSTLPWHRVLKSDGRLAFAPDSNNYQQQKQRLESEGIIFTGDKIQLKNWLWHKK